MTKLNEIFNSPLEVPIGTIVQLDWMPTQYVVVCHLPAGKSLGDLGYSKKDVQTDVWLKSKFDDFAWFVKKDHADKRISHALSKHTLSDYNVIYLPRDTTFTDSEYSEIFI